MVQAFREENPRKTPYYKYPFMFDHIVLCIENNEKSIENWSELPNPWLLQLYWRLAIKYAIKMQNLRLEFRDKNPCALGLCSLVHIRFSDHESYQIF